MSTPEAKRWASGAWRPIQAKDQRPHAPCPTCFTDCVSDATSSVIEYACPRGHAFIQTRPASLTHAAWLARLVFTSETQNSRQT